MKTATFNDVSPNYDKPVAKAKFDKVEVAAPAKSPKRMWLIALGALAATLLIAAGFTYYSYASGYESTDDAFIEGHVSQLSPKVSGWVRAVHIDDNQQVKAGDLLVEIDPRDFQVKVDQARAALETTIAQAALAQERIAQAQAQVVAAQAEATRASNDERRSAELFRRELIARQDFDHATADAHTAAAQIAEARAALQSAELELSYTKIYAPLSGRVTRKSVEVGAFI